MTIELFDRVEMIHIVLEGREYDLGIPKAFSTAMFAFSLASVLSCWYLPSKWKKLDSPKIGGNLVSVPNCIAKLFK